MIYARLRLFGEPSLTAGPDLHASPVDLSRQVERLLAYLTLHPSQPIDRRKLAFILWADSTEAVALRSLRQHLHRLRQILASLNLPDEILLSKGSQLHVNLAPDLWIDVSQFDSQITDQRWQIEAIELYRGELLAEYEADWVLPIRARLRDQYLSTLVNQITIANMQRNYPRALHYAQRLLQANPLRETAHRIYMEALYYNGQRVQALQQFAHLESLLKRTLKADPMPQTMALYRQIQKGTLPGDIPSLISPAQHAPQDLKTIVEISESFVGRRRELAQIDEALASTLNRWGRFILIEGDSGLGKTCLLHTWQHARAEQLLIFSSQAQAIEYGIPCAPILQALRQGRGQIDWQWFPKHSPWRATLRSLLVELDEDLVSLSQTADQSSTWPTVDKLGQFILTLANHASQSVGLLLDDLHNADEATWQLLAFLARRCAATPLLVVGTCQSTALPATAHCLLHSLQRRRQLETIKLWPLSPADTAKLATHLLGHQPVPDNSFLNRLYRVTEGNPFYITEFLKTTQTGDGLSSSLNVSELPKTIQAVIGSRLDQLSAPSQKLLAIAAAVGRTFIFKVLVGTTTHDYTQDQVLEALEEWLDIGLVVEKNDGYEFKHEQIQQAAYSTLTPTERRQTHQEIARVLITLPLDPRLRDPARVAYHYLNSNTPEQALPDLIASGKRALALDSPQEALALAQQCQNLLAETNFRSQTPDLVQSLKQALASPESIDQAYSTLEQIVEIWLNQ